MKTKITTKKLNLELQKSYHRSTNKTNKSISFPGNIKVYDIGRDTLLVEIDESQVIKNMQENENSIDGWGLVLNRWLNKKIVLHWSVPKNIANLHYQRFLFRIKCFIKFFSPNISLSEEAILNLNDLRLSDNEIFHTNESTGTKRNLITKSILTTEHDYELFFYNNNNIFQTILNTTTSTHKFFRQFPIGLFKHKKATKNAVFTHKKSAIDLISCDTESLNIYELKKPKNKSIGIISELFFYTIFMMNIVDGKFVLPKGSSFNFSDIKRISSFMLVEQNDLHPLIDIELINIIKSKELNFGVIFYEIEGDNCVLTTM